MRWFHPRIELTERAGQAGESIDITKHRRVIAKLVPVVLNSDASMPDFAGRMERIFGKKPLKVIGAELIRWDRDRGR